MLQRYHVRPGARYDRASPRDHHHSAPPAASTTPTRRRSERRGPGSRGASSRGPASASGAPRPGRRSSGSAAVPPPPAGDAGGGAVTASDVAAGAGVGRGVVGVTARSPRNVDTGGRTSGAGSGVRAGDAVATGAGPGPIAALARGTRTTGAGAGALGARASRATATTDVVGATVAALESATEGETERTSDVSGSGMTCSLPRSALERPPTRAAPRGGALLDAATLALYLLRLPRRALRFRRGDVAHLMRAHRFQKRKRLLLLGRLPTRSLRRRETRRLLLAHAFGLELHSAEVDGSPRGRSGVVRAQRPAVLARPELRAVHARAARPLVSETERHAPEPRRGVMPDESCGAT